MAAVLSPASDLSSPGDLPSHQSIQMEEPAIVAITSPNFLTQQMINILQKTGYEQSAINTLISRADTNTISVTNIESKKFLNGNATEGESVAAYLETTLLNAADLRRMNIYLNSNEPVVLLGYSESIGLGIEQIRILKEKVLVALRDRGVKPVRVYIRETDADAENNELSISLLNVVNSDIGVNMVSLLDAAFYGGAWKAHLVVVEAYNGYDLIWRDEAWTSGYVQVAHEAKETEAPADVPAEPEIQIIDVPAPLRDEFAEGHVESENVAAVNASQQRLPEENTRQQTVIPPIEPVLAAQYKSADDIPEDSDDETKTDAVQHPALKELLEREAQKPGVQHPTWSRNHDREAYLDIIRTHSGESKETEPISVISGPADHGQDDFELIDKP